VGIRVGVVGFFITSHLPLVPLLLLHLHVARRLFPSAGGGSRRKEEEGWSVGLGVWEREYFITHTTNHRVDREEPSVGSLRMTGGCGRERRDDDGVGEERELLTNHHLTYLTIDPFLIPRSKSKERINAHRSVGKSYHRHSVSSWYTISKGTVPNDH